MTTKSAEHKLKIEYKNVSTLNPYAKNPRRHPDKQIKKLVELITEYGFNVPILVDREDCLVTGHGRLIAAKKMGLKEIPTISVEHLTPKQVKAFRLADNRVGADSTWDDDLLRIEMIDLKIEMVDLKFTGFDEREVDRITAADDSKGGNTVIPMPTKTKVKFGDLYELGDHRLLCGDSTSREMVVVLLDGKKPILMVTDPPYGVNYDPAWRNEALTAFAAHRAVGKVQHDDRADWTAAWELFPGDVAYVWHGGLHSGAVQMSLERAGFLMRAQLIWRKPSPVVSRGDYHWQHEPCWYAVRKGKKGHWTGSRKETTSWDLKGVNPVGGGGKGNDEKLGHGTQKPVEAMRKPIVNNSKKGEHVYEPFCGSGTTLVAAELTGRRCLAMELDPLYVDMILQRWEKLTGKKAKLVGNYAPKVAAIAPAKKQKLTKASKEAVAA